MRYPRYVIKAGEMVVEEGEIRKSVEGRGIIVHPAFDPKIEEYMRPLFQQYYTMSFENYPVEMERIEHADVRPCKASDREGEAPAEPFPPGSAGASPSQDSHMTTT